MAQPDSTNDKDNEDAKDGPGKGSGSGGSKDGAEGGGKSGDAGPGDDKKDDDKDKDNGDGDKDDGDGKKKPSPLKNPIVRVVLVIVVILLLIALIVFWIRHESYGKYQQTTNDAYIGADQASVTARVAGWVTEVLVGDNEHVRPGQPLVRLDPREVAGRVEQALGTLKQGSAQAAQAEAQIRQQRAQIQGRREQVAQYQAQMRQYRASEAYYQSEVDRYAPLVASGAEPVEKLAQNVAQRDQARAQHDAARAQRDGARADVLYQLRQIPVLETQRLAGEGQIQSARGTLQTNQTDLEQTTLVAPIEGRAGNRSVRPGQYVQPGTILMNIVPLQAQYLDANFKETQIGLMRVGQPATITVDAIPGATISGTVDSFSPGTGNRFALVPQNNATGNFTKIVQRVTVRIHIDDDGQEIVRRVLVPGLSVEVSVDTRSAKDDLDRIKQQKKASDDERKEQRKDAVEQQKGKPASGAGGG